MNLIELTDIQKTFGKGHASTPVLRGINLKIAKGEFIAIMGPSGSGKTTLMNVIGLLDQPDHGNYLLDATPVSKLKESELAKLRRQAIGFVFQNFSLLSRLSAFNNVALPMRYAGVNQEQRKTRTNKLLKLVGLSERANNKPSQLSGGEMQRVAIARALANRPSLILADEPTGNLDSKTGKTVLDLLTRLNKAGSTIIMVTHDDKVAKAANRIIKLKDGKVAK